MLKKYDVLIIDDHPLIAEAYRSALLKIETTNNIRFNIEIANTIDDALEKIKSSEYEKESNLFFLDIKLPPSKEHKVLSGEDLGIRIRQLIPNAKIIVATTFDDNFRIQSILKNVNPEGFLIKGDVSPKELLIAFMEVIEDPPYYSKGVLKFLRKNAHNTFVLDKVDRQLLYELSIGTKMKDMPTILPLSKAGIEKRKRHLKDIFKVSGQDDRSLILKAKEKGFI